MIVYPSIQNDWLKQPKPKLLKPLMLISIHKPAFFSPQRPLNKKKLLETDQTPPKQLLLAASSIKQLTQLPPINQPNNMPP